MNEHVNYITSKAKRTLGFVKRHAKQFQDPYVTKAIYCALVRPTLEYCLVSWMPFTKLQIDEIESVQRQFLLFALLDLRWNYPYMLPKYEDRLKLIHLDSLNKRRTIISSSFMYKLLNGFIDVLILKDQLILNESRYSTRTKSKYVQQKHSTNYGMNEPVTRLIKLYNVYEDNFANSSSVNKFKSRLRSEICN